MFQMIKEYINNKINIVICYIEKFENDVHMDNMSNDEYLSNIVNSYK